VAEGAWRRQIADFIEDDLLLIRQLEPPDLPRIDQHHGPPGWTAVTFRPGDAITMIGPPMKDVSKGISLFYTIVPDGKRMARQTS
jgi:hypothetical protein